MNQSLFSAGALIVFLASCASPTSPTFSADVPAVYKKFTASVYVYVSGDYIVVESKDLPNHKSPYWGVGNALYEEATSGVKVNPNYIKEQTLTFKIPKNPSTNAAVTATSLGAMGVALNSVPLYNQYAAGNTALDSEIVSFDRFNGHPQQSGQYHYHFEPVAISSNGSELIGFLLDGFPVYGRKDKDGSTPTNLDSAHGHFGVTDDYPNGTYHYHITLDTPYISGGFRGTPGTVSK